MVEEYFGIRFEFNHDEVHRVVEEYVREGKTGYICQVEGHNLAVSVRDPKHLGILNDAIFNNSDSAWIPVLLNRIYGTDYGCYAGPDFFLDIVKKKCYRQFFLGSRRQVLDGLRNEMIKLDPAVGQMRFEELPYCESAEDFDYRAIAEMINEDAPDIIWVSLGAPKQEHFMNLLQPHLKRGVMVGVGAAFNFYSNLPGVPQRAPQLMIDLRLEWLYRLVKEPRKQIERDVVIPLTFLKVYMAEKKHFKKNCRIVG